MVLSSYALEMSGAAAMVQRATTRLNFRMTPLARYRRRIQGFGPYQSLALIAVPLLVVEPLKLLALVVAGEGHWLSGSLVVLGAYVASLFFVERLFRIVKPKLMCLPWFSGFWSRAVTMRSRLMSLFGQRSVDGSP
jgi:hypothetical protein